MDEAGGGRLHCGQEETKKPMRLMAEKARVIAEGAGALSVAEALTGNPGQGPIVAIVSAGNVDLKIFCEIIGSIGPSSHGFLRQTSLLSYQV